MALFGKGKHPSIHIQQQSIDVHSTDFARQITLEDLPVQDLTGAAVHFPRLAWDESLLERPSLMGAPQLKRSEC